MMADQIARQLSGDDGEIMPIPGLVDRRRPPVAAPRTVWTDALVARLIDLAQAGRSNSQIAAALGPAFTGNMVAGKLHRLGGVVTRPERPAPEPRSARPRQPKPTKAAAQPAGTADVVPEAPKRRARREPPAPRLRVSAFRECQWIAGEPSFDDACKCRRPTVEGFSYCADHNARAWSGLDPDLDKAMRRGAIGAARREGRT